MARTDSEPGAATIDAVARSSSAVALACLLVLAVWVDALAQAGHRVGGHVSLDPSCHTNAAGVTVSLRPGGLSAQTGTDGRFSIDGVADGDYAVLISPDCEPRSCYPETQVSIAGEDAAVEVCQIICAVNMSPLEGRPGTSVGVGGRCYYVHSGQTADLLFDDVVLGRTGPGDTIGDFGGYFVVPDDAAFGSHRVVLGHKLPDIIVQLWAAMFKVIAVECPGDCSGDGGVDTSELQRGMALALGATGDQCLAFDLELDGVVTVDDLISAVRRHLATCAESTP